MKFYAKNLIKGSQNFKRHSWSLNKISFSNDRKFLAFNLYSWFNISGVIPGYVYLIGRLYRCSYPTLQRIRNKNELFRLTYFLSNLWFHTYGIWYFTWNRYRGPLLIFCDIFRDFWEFERLAEGSERAIMRRDMHMGLIWFYQWRWQKKWHPLRKLGSGVEGATKIPF